MKHSKLLLLSLFIIAITACQTSDFDYAGAVVIQNITTIDAVNGTNENQYVVIREGKIIKVSDTEDLSGIENVEIMAGTDTPIGLLTPGKSLHRELYLLVKAGLSPLEALKTATLNPARYFGMEDELGSIEEGMWADLIILNSNPLDDIRNTKEIHTVIRQGNVLDPAALNQMKERLTNQ